MNFTDLIIKKRGGGCLTDEELDFFVSGTVTGSIPDYQLSAMLMAIFFRGMEERELTRLTVLMAEKGETLDLSEVPGIKVDKHSTGGVADTATLILAPLVASAGAPVIKMSGRGLGFSGGTIDKLMSIPGFDCFQDTAAAVRQCREIGIVISSQTGNLTPADKKLYSLRDVTGTVDSIPLIAASVMSKKLAGGADAIVLDVKCGSGAFMKTLPEAQSLARSMVGIGRGAGRRVRAVITSMDQPLGKNIGNSLEVIEAMEVLKGRVAGELLEVSLELGSHMLVLAGVAADTEAAREILSEKIKNGDGIEKFREFVARQKGDPCIIDDYSLLPVSPKELKIYAEGPGFVYSMDTEGLGRAFLETGGGRKQTDDIIDYGAGIIMNVRIGDYVNTGGLLAAVYSGSAEKAAAAAALVSSAIRIRGEKPEKPRLVLDIIE